MTALEKLNILYYFILLLCIISNTQLAYSQGGPPLPTDPGGYEYDVPLSGETYLFIFLALIFVVKFRKRILSGIQNK